jgi:hypothetical protein
VVIKFPEELTEELQNLYEVGKEVFSHRAEYEIMYFDQHGLLPSPSLVLWVVGWMCSSSEMCPENHSVSL